MQCALRIPPSEPVGIADRTVFSGSTVPSLCSVALVHDMETRAEKLCPCLIGFDNIVYPKETLNKARLTALHAICLQIFPSYCPEIPCQTYSLPAEFLCNLPKNLTTHLTHKLYAVFP
jgi:hypothetical protein